MLQKLRDNKGEFLLESAFKILLAAAGIVFAISIFGTISQANRLAAMANDLTRSIELKGEVNMATVNAELSRLSSAAGLDGVTVTVEATYTAGGRRIQMGDAFTVTLNYTGHIGIGGALSIPIPLRSTVTGRSEQYWK